MGNGDFRVELRKLTPTEKAAIERREQKHRDKLARRGYKTRTLVDESGCFGVVLVEDPQSKRKGLLMRDGDVRWLDGPLGPGALSEAAVTGVTINRGPK